MKLILLLTLMSCVSAPPPRVDWRAIDAVFQEARWRVVHCAEPNSERCDAMWLLHDELDALIDAGREAKRTGLQLQTAPAAIGACHPQRIDLCLGVTKTGEAWGCSPDMVEVCE